LNDTSMLMLILGWIVFGGIVGLLARAIFPGRQSMGWVATIGLGIAGSFIGGMLANFFFGGGRLFVMQSSGWIGSIVGALVALALFTLVTRRRFAR
jgi:uncharacterized membrane protein YeaQ/YmgE (transglycosylase-associated protein family)